MAVEKLDLKQIWEEGQTYEQWLGACQDQNRREVIGLIFKDLSMPEAELQIIQNLKRPVHVLALAEDWCGDVRRNTPVLGRLCAENPRKLKLRLVDKESKPQLMVRYLTNAAEAIPIFVFLNDGFVEVGNWGPRPYECKKFMARGKAAGKIDDARAKIGDFYTQDAHQSTIRELRELIETAAAESA